MMRCGLIARKLGMSRVFDDNGEHIPVTILRIEDLEVLSIKSADKDGYNAIQLGFCNKKSKNIPKPLKGHFSKAKSEPKEKIAEFRVSEDAVLEVGDKLGVNHFIVGQKVDVIGTSQGKGFSGAMKRHNFGGLRASHGVSISHRAHGSTGHSQDPGKVFKGKKMAGHMGDKIRTMQNIEIIRSDKNNNLLYLKGSIPGAKNAEVVIKKAVKNLRKLTMSEKIEQIEKMKKSADKKKK